MTNLEDRDLIVDAIYGIEHDSNGRALDPLSRLMHVKNSGGFRFRGSPTRKKVSYAVIFTSGVNPDWPDILDKSTGLFLYHGDQREPGRELHDTGGHGNIFLRDIFALASQGPEGREQVPPLFLFESAGSRKDVIFRGLMVPGQPGSSGAEDLVASWRMRNGGRYHNYRALFTVLDAPLISRRWIDSLAPGHSLNEHAPTAWREWVKSGRTLALVAPSPVDWRSKAQQLPQRAEDQLILDTIREHFRGRESDFEPLAAQIWSWTTPGIEISEVTQAVRDGGRDAIGFLRLGPAGDPIKLSFSLEAKCYAMNTPVKVQDLSRLISRIRHREFGVLVTLSYLHLQAYQELRSDQHPIVVLAGVDIVNILRDRRISTHKDLKDWLTLEYPPPALDLNSE